MKKLLYLLLITPIIYLASCGKSNVTPQSQSLEDVIVGVEWSLSNENEDGFLLAEDGKFYLTEKCQSNTPIGNWIIDGDLIKYQFTDNTQEITILWGEVIEYSESQIKLLDYSDSLVTITDVYILDPTDIYGCMDVAAINYNSEATCDNASCCYVSGCTDSTANNYNQWACIDDASCCFGDDLCVGSLYQGGIIFYLDGNGGGLISSLEETTMSRPWGCEGTQIEGADGTAIGTGTQNTIDIESGCTTSEVAADVCANLTLNGYSDWFLPSIDELNEMYLIKDKINEASHQIFQDNLHYLYACYWSSSEIDNNDAWHWHFGIDSPHSGGYKTAQRKSGPCSVRAIRAF